MDKACDGGTATNASKIPYLASGRSFYDSFTTLAAFSCRVRVDTTLRVERCISGTATGAQCGSVAGRQALRARGFGDDAWMWPMCATVVLCTLCV